MHMIDFENGKLIGRLPSSISSWSREANGVHHPFAGLLTALLDCPQLYYTKLANKIIINEWSIRFHS